MEELTGRTTAHIVSAVPLTEKQISLLRDLLSKKVGNHVEVIQSIDAELLGGLSIHVAGYVLDNSIKRHLRDMREHIKRSTSYAV